MLNRAAAIIVANLDIIMIAYLLELQNIPIYGLGFFIAAVILIPQKAILLPTNPIISKALKEDNLKDLKKLYQQSSINQLIIGGVIFLLIWINIDQIFALVPSEFSAGKWVVFYIGISRLIIISSGISGTIIVFSKYFRTNLYFNLILIGLTVLSNFLLISRYGITGAAIATAITFLVYNIFKVIYVKYRFNMQPFTLESIKTVSILIIIGILTNYIEIFIEIPILSIITKSLISLLFLAIAFYGLKVKAEILDFPMEIYKRLKRNSN